MHGLQRLQQRVCLVRSCSCCLLCRLCPAGKLPRGHHLLLQLRQRVFQLLLQRHHCCCGSIAVGQRRNLLLQLVHRVLQRRLLRGQHADEGGLPAQRHQRGSRPAGRPWPGDRAAGALLLLQLQLGSQQRSPVVLQRLLRMLTASTRMLLHSTQRRLAAVARAARLPAAATLTSLCCRSLFAACSATSCSASSSGEWW